MIFQALPRRGGGEYRGTINGGGPEGCAGGGGPGGGGFDGGTLLSIRAHTTRGSGLAQGHIVWEESAAIVEPRAPISLARSILIGTVGFTVASLIVYGFWAGAGRFMYRTFGEAGFYAVCAVLFVVLGAVFRDAEAAHKAQIAFGAVTWGQHSLAALRAQSPAEIFAAVHEIADKLC
jgi:hypothetical protein